MSLPLTRRIARAALLVAAGAAPVVGAAGSAGAAELPATPDLGGVTTLDNAGPTADGATRHVTGLAGDAGAGDLGDVDRKEVKKAAGDVTGSAGDAVGAATKSTGGELPTDGLPQGGTLPTKQLPVQDLPVG
ncbi:ATP-binding protein [Streptomyces montanus]|uniref:ATP-binding protein n=1 Tax=Streptomyces montanus TaxID=2580423 RepID=A0A5R9FDA8_9ACTN|nr:ATP-binding protein [Streptomyces montanus]TLS41722.1 ATP-binding protein [Streptomyces montanus]